MLRKGLAGGIESGESLSGDTLKSPTDQPPQRFNHYELVTGEEGGRPVELGRGAYQAFDFNLPAMAVYNLSHARSREL
jgi:hypothetical protein